MPVELVHVSAECLPFEEARFDFALSTWTLCSIPDAISALREVRRVLKPKGLLVFLEHGLGVDPKVATWQNRLNPIQRVLACGCNINRPIDALIQEAGLEITRLERFQMEGIPGSSPKCTEVPPLPLKPNDRPASFHANPLTSRRDIRSDKSEGTRVVDRTLTTAAISP